MHCSLMFRSLNQVIVSLVELEVALDFLFLYVQEETPILRDKFSTLVYKMYILKNMGICYFFPGEYLKSQTYQENVTVINYQ